jgi:hypothetical protein
VAANVGAGGGVVVGVGTDAGVGVGSVHAITTSGISKTASGYLGLRLSISYSLLPRH